MLRLGLYCYAALSFVLFAAAKPVVLNWDIGYTSAKPDGKNDRRVIGINGKWPPPVVNVNVGDTLTINANNRLDEPTSLHTHGFFQNGTNYYDGAVGATECGIPPNGSYTYRMNVTQSGTFWIHSHYLAQYVDGLRTPLISKPAVEHYKYDEEMVLMLEAWYNRNSHDINDQLLSTSEATRLKPFLPTMLINSRGGSDVNITKLSFKPGKKYRLRLLNVSGTGMIRFGIEHHMLDVIELDGVDSEIKSVPSIQLSAGQRASVLVTAKNNTDYNYAFHADIFTDMQAGVERAEIPHTGTVEYAPNAPMIVPVSIGNGKTNTTMTWDFFDDIDMVPIEKIPSPGVNKWMPLEVRTAIYDDRREHMAFNNRTYWPPLVPSLFTALTTGYQAYFPDVYGFKTYPVILDHLEDVEVAIFNTDTNSHPFHIHGHNFFIIVRGTIDKNPKNRREAVSFPMRRDTITVPAQSYAIVRFRADNPGVWMMHCHMQFHNDQGLAMTFIEAPFQIINNTGKLPDQLLKNCNALGIPTSGNAMGRLGLDLANDPRGPYPLAGF
ncbi:ferroxidase fet3 [Coemansia sp. S610]|uniref:Ferroxidase fet3 n=1 Tax=Coemansia linderi TaxID=2663919 RepID=A0ACC1KPV5_9FUNG|nr:ferroxidase fet3 [Coemansia sp. S610]KAJ2792564.1 ferroxidase fet3 [Coemansia linderi]